MWRMPMGGAVQEGERGIARVRIRGVIWNLMKGETNRSKKKNNNGGKICYYMWGFKVTDKISRALTKKWEKRKREKGGK